MPTLTDLAAALTAPFALEAIELLPGATSQDKQRCLAMAYADLRVYQARLDEDAGIEFWSSTYQMTARGIVCSLTICGVTKSGIGDYPADSRDENAATSAEAQAFKRACSAFGIGRYLYSLPKVWCAYDEFRKRIVNPERAAWEMYREAGLLSPEQRKSPPAIEQPRTSGAAKR